MEVLAEPQDQSRFRLSVKDNGIGIKEEDIKRLFTQFEQIESGTSRHYEGTGLGLVVTGGKSWNCKAEQSMWRAKPAKAQPSR